MGDDIINIQSALTFISKFYKPIISFLILMGFFFFYNTFLIDHTLENLRFSLEQTALAYDISDLDGLDILLNQMMVEEILPEKMNLVNIANLEYVRNAIAGGKSYRVIDSVKTSLDIVIKEKEIKRGTFLTILDALNRYLKNAYISFIGSLRDFFGGKRAPAPPTTKIMTEFLNKTQGLEKSGRLEAALTGYDEFIKKYPSYEKIGLVKIRAANIYQKLGQYDKAFLLYKDIIKKHVGKKESYLAQLLLFRLEQIGKLRRKANILLSDLAELKKEQAKARQDILYQLGTINLELQNLEEAKKFFKRATSADPESDLAMKARFNSAWASKEENKVEESVSEFSKIVKERPKSILALDSRYQIADAYHKEGRYKESIELYLKLAEEFKGDPISSLCLFQAGASYMYDLNDDEKAREIFARLTKEYPDSPYAKYLAPDNPVGVFITYLVPRATRVVTWRAGGLLALSGYAGELTKFKVTFDETQFNHAFNDWLKAEVPDTIGNMWVDIKGAEIEFLKDKFAGRGRITMGRFNVVGEAEGHFELTKEGSINLVLTKTILEKIPIPPILINNALTGISLIVRKHFPFILNKISIDKGKMTWEGYGSKRVLSILQERSKQLLGIEIELEDIKGPNEQAALYKSIKEKFPESNFSTLPKEDSENLFLDFFTRMYFYLGFKLLETTKDTKLDYERSIRTLGRILVKKGKFKVNYKEADINASLARLTQVEFPWIVAKEFIIDVKGFELHFTDKGYIRFEGYINVGRVHFPIRPGEVKELKMEATAVLNIDKESKLPLLVFKELSLNGNPFPVDKINLITFRGLNLLKNGHVPFELEEVKISDGSIALKGVGARDFTTRVFSDPYLFVIFQIREWDLWAAGIQRLKERPSEAVDYWRGRGFQKGQKEAVKMGEKYQGTFKEGYR